MQVDRQQFLGGSECAAVMGMSEWSTPVTVWLRKTGQFKPDDADRKRERIFDRGRREEPHIINDLVELCGIKITKRSTPEAPNRYPDPEHAFLAAEIDAEWEVTAEAVARLAAERGIEIPEELIGTTQNVEAKTAHPFVARKKFGDEGTDEIPIEYYCQAMHGLMVTGRQVCLVALRVYVDDPILYVVHRDEAQIAAMREKEVRFWHENVLAKVAPEPLRIEDVQLLLRPGIASKREATPEVAAWVQTLRTLRARKATFEEGIDAIQFELGRFLLGADAMEKPKPENLGKHFIYVDGKPALWLSQEHQDRIDSDALRLKHPAVALECTKTITVHKFTLKRSTP